MFALLLISFSIPVIVADNWTIGVPNTSFAAKHVCPSKCGSLTVPYPFGIKSDSACSMNPSFDILCDESFDPPQAFLSPLSGHIMVSGIYETTIHIKNQPARTCYKNGTLTAVEAFGMNFSGTPFSFSNENKLTAVGCDEAAFILRSPNSNLEEIANEFIASCVAICSENGDLSSGFCSGIGCCQASIPKGVQSIYYYMKTLHGCDHEQDNLSACSYSFLAEPDSYTFNISDILDPAFLDKIREVPIVLDWAIDNRTCNQCANAGEMMCQRHSVCVDSDSPLGGYHCNCSHGYQGNPYLSPGCQG